MWLSSSKVKKGRKKISRQAGGCIGSILTKATNQPRSSIGHEDGVGRCWSFVVRRECFLDMEGLNRVGK